MAKDTLAAKNDFLIGKLLERQGFVITFQLEDYKIGDVIPPSSKYPFSIPMRIIDKGTRSDSIAQIAIAREYFPSDNFNEPPDVDYGWWKCVVAD